MTPTFVLAVLLKGLIVLGIALGLSLLFRRTSASVRHGVWVAAFVALLALPVLEAMGPKWSIPVGPVPTAIEGVLAPLTPIAPVAPLPPMPPAPPAPPPPPEVSVLTLDRHAAQMDRHAARIERHAARVERQIEMEVQRMERQIERDAARIEARANRLVMMQRGGTNAPVVLASAPATVVQTFRSVPREIVLAMLWFWGLGALAVGLAWAVAYAAAARAVRMGLPETDEDRLATWERIRLLSGVTRPVRLLRSPALDVPIAWGWGNAAVVLPTSADDWDDDRMEAVLLHELAHILRGDALTQLVAQVALVLHWANPLAWLAYRRVLLEREHACDDIVLEHGARPSAYADHLVQVARDLRRRSAALAAVAPMARHSHLEGRVRSILDPARKRAALGRAAGAMLTLLLCAIAMPVAALQPTTGPDACDGCDLAIANVETDGPAPAPVVSPTPRATHATASYPEPDPLAVEIEDVVATVRAIELAMHDEPERRARLALDTIPRFEDVIRPALEGALAAVRAMRDSERYAQLELSDEAWDEMEEDIREAIDDARKSYDDAIQEAIEDALDDMEDADWSVSWSDQADGAHVGGYTSEEALDHARREIERAQQDAQRAMRNVQKEIQKQVRKAEHAQRQVFVESRGRTEARNRPRDARITSYSYTVSDEGVSLSQSSGHGVQGWVDGLDNLNKGLDGIETSITNVERAQGPTHPAALAGLSASLSGIHNGLSGIATEAETWNGSESERRVVKQRIRSTQTRLRGLQRRIENCED